MGWGGGRPWAWLQSPPTHPQACPGGAEAGDPHLRVASAFGDLPPPSQGTPSPGFATGQGDGERGWDPPGHPQLPDLASPPCWRHPSDPPSTALCPTPSRVAIPGSVPLPPSPVPPRYPGTSSTPTPGAPGTLAPLIPLLPQWPCRYPWDPSAPTHHAPGTPVRPLGTPIPGTPYSSIPVLPVSPSPKHPNCLYLWYPGATLVPQYPSTPGAPSPSNPSIPVPPVLSVPWMSPPLGAPSPSTPSLPVLPSHRYPWCP